MDTDVLKIGCGAILMALIMSWLAGFAARNGIEILFFGSVGYLSICVVIAVLVLAAIFK